jgi:hypothetical protein
VICPFDTISRILTFWRDLPLAARQILRLQPEAKRGIFMRSSLAAVLCFASFSASAQSFIDDDGGGAYLTGYFLFPPSAADITLVEQQIVFANDMIWDATDGQIYLAQIRLTDDPRDRRNADVLFIAGPGGAGSNKLAVTRNNAATQYDLSNAGGARTMLFQNFNVANREKTFGHELGHLVLGLWDEYSANRTGVAGVCGGRGPCIDTETQTDSCIMQSYSSGNFELCTSQNHDLVKGDGLTGARCQSADPCVRAECEKWNAATNRFETSRTANPTLSCWEILQSRFPVFAVAPTQSVVAAATPAPLTTIVNDTNPAKFVVVLADQSGSMNLPVLGAVATVCTGVNAAGVNTPAGCALPRWSAVKSAVDIFSVAAQDAGISVALKTFNGTVTDTITMQTLSSANSASYATSLNAITPSGQTAIGTALTSADTTMNGVAAAGDARSILLITDGENTVGPNPVPIATTLINQGTRIFTAITGVEGEAGSIAVLDAEDVNQSVAPNASFLAVSLMQHWAALTGKFPLTPPLRYSVDSKLTNTRTMPQASLVDFWQSWSTATKTVQTTLVVPSGVSKLQVMVAEQPDTTRGLDVTFSLTSPGAAVFTSTPTTTSAGLTVTRRNGFLFATINTPAAGNWIMKVTAPASGEYRGVVQAFAQRSEVFSELWATKTAPNQYLLEFNAFYHTPLSVLSDVTFRAVSRAGVVTTLAGTPSSDNPYVYQATLDLTNQSTGLWNIAASGRATAATRNDPGEPLFNPAFAVNTVTVPLMLFNDNLAVQSIK